MSFDRTMSSRRFKVALRPRLSAITEHPKMDFVDYERRLTSLQGVLQLIQQAYLGTPERAIIVLEGSDTSGKGGIVRRLGWALDPRSFRVNPVASPDEHERAQHYLQRFWRRLPEHGQIVVFDRSWYGRVLVERIQGFATETEWRRAYRQDDDFERVLSVRRFAWCDCSSRAAEGQRRALPAISSSTQSSAANCPLGGVRRSPAGSGAGD